MILFIDCEHPKLGEKQSDLYNLVQQRRLKAMSLFSKLSAMPCQMIHLSTLEHLQLPDHRIKFIITSGFHTLDSVYPKAWKSSLSELYHNPFCPTLAICGSFQWMIESFGGKIAPIGKSPEPTNSKDPAIPNNMLCEIGFCKIDWVDPAGWGMNLPNSSLFYQHHFWEIKSLPDCFHRRASSDLTPIQMVTHKSKPLAGCQFHPEDATTANNHGIQFLKNFFNYQWFHQ